MKHSDSRHLPEIISEGGHLVDPRNRGDAIGELASRERQEYFLDLRETAREVAERLLTPENTFSVGRGGRGMDQGAIQSLATYFNIWVEPDPDVRIEWDENRPFLQAHRNQEQTPPGVAPVAEHCTARVTVRVRTPWGHEVEKTGVCSTRGKHFWHSKGGELRDYNMKKYREGAAHICAGIAETRATSRAVRAALMIGGEQFKDEDVSQERDEKRHREKREKSERLRLEQEYTRLLSAYEISPEEEDAFRVVVVKVPDHYDDWTAEHFELAIKALDRKGRAFYRKCLQKVEGYEGGGRDGDDAAGPPGGEPDPEPASEVTQAPAGEAEDEAEDTVSPADAKKRKTLVGSIDGTCRLLGEDMSLAEEWAGKMFAEEPGTMIPLDDLSLEELEQVDQALTEELKEGGQP